MESILTVSVGLYHNTTKDKYYLQSITAETEYHFFFETTKECAELISEKNFLSIEPITTGKHWETIQPLLPPTLIYQSFGTEETEMQVLITASMGLCTLPDRKGTFVQIILADTYQFLFFRLSRKIAYDIISLTRMSIYRVEPDIELLKVAE
jgi:hypothetical protein